jgi:hypothetical protein
MENTFEINVVSVKIQDSSNSALKRRLPQRSSSGSRFRLTPRTFRGAVVTDPLEDKVLRLGHEGGLKGEDGKRGVEISCSIYLTKENISIY